MCFYFSSAFLLTLFIRKIFKGLLVSQHMSDPDHNSLTERREKLKRFFQGGGEESKHAAWYFGVYAAVIILLFVFLGQQFRLGKLWLFVVIPALTLGLFFFRKWAWGVLLNIVAWGFIIRVQNLPLLKDVSTGNWIPTDLDPYAFLRYARYILEHGELMQVDMLRYYPLGFTGLGEFKFLSYFIVYLYKFLHFFSSSITLELADILYPPIIIAIGVVFFYLLVKKLFNARAALIASVFLIVVPAFLYRSMGGVPDKEPFGIAMMFAAFYFYIISLKSERMHGSFIHAGLAGVATGLMGLAWGGVTTIFLAVGLTTIVEVFLGKLKRKDMFAYGVFVAVTTFMLLEFSAGRFNFGSLLTSFTSAIMFFALAFVFVHLMLFEYDIFRVKKRVEEKYPLGFVSAGIVVVLGLLIVPLAYGGGFGYIGERVKDIYTDLIEPFGRSRWALTVAENHQPFLTDWVNNFGGWGYVWLFLVGSVFLFYQLVKNLEQRHVWKLMTGYTLFILLFVFSRYTPESVLNGSSMLSKFAYLGSLLVFVAGVAGFYWYCFVKDKREFEKILKFDQTLTFVIIWLVISLIAARGAIRLLFLLAPVTAVIAGYVADDLLRKVHFLPGYGYVKKSLFLTVIFFFLLLLIPQLSSKFFVAGFIAAALGFILPAFLQELSSGAREVVRILGYCFLGFFFLSLLFAFTQSTIAQAASIGLAYNQQWQEAGKWVRENTPTNAVFAHWWDYGYWVQTGWERATLSDGGNARGAINYFIGRHVLTGNWSHEKKYSEEALQVLGANNASHLLIVADEVGKYTAYSSIGSDANYDRYAWITTFGLDRNQIRETRNQTIYVYTGGTPLDEDLIYQNQIFPAQAAGIGGFYVPLQIIQADGQAQASISQPQAVIVYQGQQVQLPLECVYFNGVVQYYPNAALKGCLRFTPVISGNQGDPLGAVLYLSPRVSKTLFAHLYLFGEESPYFKMVYSDEERVPFALYQGRLIGPIKIWEVSYPEQLDIPKEFYGTELPDPRVNYVR